MDNLIHNIHKTYINTVSKITPTLTESEFEKKGVLTPEEFVAAGDLLVYKCPTWSWATGDPNKTVPYLPKDKQYLITNRVPCSTPGENNKSDQAQSEMVDDDWLAVTKDVMNREEDDDIPDMEQDKVVHESKDEEDDDEGEVPDMDTWNEDDNLLEGDAATVTSASHTAHTVKRRTYDISITYDKYYQTPRVWLYGYDENGQPLSDLKLMYRDMSESHAKKTITIDTHPHLNLPFASIHPCRHAQVMKKIVDLMLIKNKQPRVDQYLFLFLKFLSAVIPTIEYDFTFDMDITLLE
eukprot:TRINITY_DN921_c0_g1_i1.p1 TRINITY_DN921_c0_g1~~TRINITY_DN921_c0_g1_i1.p1  ORF type:complete len:313 (-),score=121.83 TRINITY_DN921_c0_g1_i1:70-954(-)